MGFLFLFVSGESTRENLVWHLKHSTLLMIVPGKQLSFQTSRSFVMSNSEQTHLKAFAVGSADLRQVVASGGHGRLPAVPVGDRDSWGPV